MSSDSQLPIKEDEELLDHFPRASKAPLVYRRWDRQKLRIPSFKTPLPQLFIKSLRVPNVHNVNHGPDDDSGRQALAAAPRPTLPTADPPRRYTALGITVPQHTAPAFTKNDRHRPADPDAPAADASNVAAGGVDPELFVIELRLAPIFAGITLPVSLMLDIVPLTGAWIINPENGSHDEYEAQALSIAALVLGFLAVLAYLMRCSEHQISLSTIAVISFSTANAICQLIAASAFIRHHHLVGNRTYSVQIYCTFVSAAISLVTVTLLTYDWSVTQNFRHRGSGLTDKQRVLFLILSSLIIWVIIGGLVFSRIEDWNLVVGMYFSLVTATAIGFGDYSVTSNLGKALLFPFALVGIVLFGFCVSAIHTVVLESVETRLNAEIQHLYQRRRRYRRKLRARLRNALIEGNITYTHSHLVAVDASVGHRLSNRRRLKQQTSVLMPARSGSSTHPISHHRPRLFTKIFHTSSHPNATTLSGSDVSGSSESESDGDKDDPSGPTAADGPAVDSQPRARRRRRHLTHREELSAAEHHRRMQYIAQFMFALLCGITFWCVGAVIFTFLLEVSYYEAFYFCFVAFTTIGYGDVTPRTEAAQICFIFYVFIGITTVTYFISTSSTIWRRVIRNHVKRVEFRRRLKAYYYWQAAHVTGPSVSLFRPSQWRQWREWVMQRFTYSNHRPATHIRTVPDHSTALGDQEKGLAPGFERAGGNGRPTSPPPQPTRPVKPGTTRDDQLRTSGDSQRNTGDSDPETNVFEDYPTFVLREDLDNLLDAIHGFDAMADFIASLLRSAVREHMEQVAQQSQPGHAHQTATPNPIRASTRSNRYASLHTATLPTGSHHMASNQYPNGGSLNSNGMKQGRSAPPFGPAPPPASNSGRTLETLTTHLFLSNATPVILAGNPNELSFKQSTAADGSGNATDQDARHWINTVSQMAFDNGVDPSVLTPGSLGDGHASAGLAAPGPDGQARHVNPFLVDQVAHLVQYQKSFEQVGRRVEQAIKRLERYDG
ncbi:Potassium channel [Tieghemiomyces parasiticus]|uniref:Potassium channel n=1 Tax=Tieghemiomyces parasiticus TaxID=78921 RepID=A0A9W8ABN4_9FUNG|nr:Potassium channel [Tieghemiomyces parasiticus]